MMAKPKTFKALVVVGETAFAGQTFRTFKEVLAMTDVSRRPG